MDYKKLNTTIDFKFCDGDEVKMTLAFYALYKLKSSNKSLYERYTKAMAKLAKDEYDELDTITILYAAYLCALDGEGEAMSEIDFLIKCGSDRPSVVRAIRQLTQPKKK